LTGDLRLHIVGSSPAMPRPGGACSCYLLRTDKARVLLDLGIGACAKLQLAVDYTLLDGVVISHLHPDHFFDLVPLRYGLKYGDPQPSHRLPVWIPPGGRRTLDALSELIEGEGDSSFFADVFDVTEYDPAKPLLLRDLRLSFRKTQHYIDAFAIRAECKGSVVAYSADTAPCDAIVQHARDADVFLCETALGLDTEEGERGHTSAEEAGEMASRADAKRLVLTHYPAAYAPEALVAAASRSFSGEIEAASDGLEIPIR
jgi:ribonuclease BN (tRNA processing enzyme)